MSDLTDSDIGLTDYHGADGQADEPAVRALRRKANSHYQHGSLLAIDSDATKKEDTSYATIGSKDIAADTLEAEERLRIVAYVHVVTKEGSDTFDFRLRFAGNTVVEEAGVNVSADDVVRIEADVRVKSTGGSGSVSGTGLLLQTSGSGPRIGNLRDTTFDTTTATTVAVQYKASSSGGGTENKVELEDLQVLHAHREG